MTRNTLMDTAEAVRQIRDAAAAKKCWRCGCFRGALDAIEKELSEKDQGAELHAALVEGRKRLVPVQYDCLGCRVCYPAIATNALELEGECAAPPVEERSGWPPLPGAYRVLRYQAPVAVCMLTSESLTETIASATVSSIALTGTLYTENLGIERIVTNVLANPHIRFLIVCGDDSKQAIGHLPGQSLLALASNGLDDRGRIIGAHGKRPLIRNLPRDAVERFRSTVEVVDRIGEHDAQSILRTAQDCARRNPGTAPRISPDRMVPRERGSIPKRMTSDPAGYFVVYVDRRAKQLSLEHYASNGVLDVVIDGNTTPEIYMRAIELNLLSRLDHAAYLGRELTRAECALTSGEPYIQDAAPERALAVSNASCGCDPTCTGDEPC